MNLEKLIQQVTQQLLAQKKWIATAESCTGGLLAHYLTSISGSSSYFSCGIIAYSNYAKQELLGVTSHTLEANGAVSEQTALEMALGIKNKSAVDIGLSTTGIAGPTGGTKEKPIGLVYIGIATETQKRVRQFKFSGTRQQNKEATCIEAFHLIGSILEQS